MYGLGLGWMTGWDEVQSTNTVLINCHTIIVQRAQLMLYCFPKNYELLCVLPLICLLSKTIF